MRLTQQSMPASTSLGYRNQRAMEAGTLRPANELLAGDFSARSLPSGIAFWRSDLTALCSHEQHALIDRSLMIRLLLSPSPTELELDGRRSIVRPHEIFAYRAVATLGGVSRSYAGERYQCLGLHIHPDLIADEQIAQQVDTFLKQGGDLSISMTPSIAALANELFGGRYTDKTADLLCESWALNVIARCLDSVATAPPKRQLTPSQVQSLLRVRDFINTHASEPLSINALAKEAGMSMSTFKQKYRHYFNETPFETVRCVRLDRALAALSSGQLSVSEAAYQSGYAHVSSFSDAFFKRFGRRPSN